jgi:hypothetical protein
MSDGSDNGNDNNKGPSAGAGVGVGTGWGRWTSDYSSPQASSLSLLETTGDSDLEPIEPTEPNRDLSGQGRVWRGDEDVFEV